MSRIGKKQLDLPEKVKANFANGVLSVEGPLGKQSLPVPGEIGVEVGGRKLQFSRLADNRSSRMLHGLTRALARNLVAGVSEGFKRVLEIEGIGYRAEAKGKSINLTLGFSHPVEFPLPNGVTAAVEKQTKIILSGIDKKLVGQVAADIRALKPPEPYKGKGIKYEGEYIQRKVGKAAASTGAK